MPTYDDVFTNWLHAKITFSNKITDYKLFTYA